MGAIARSVLVVKSVMKYNDLLHDLKHVRVLLSELETQGILLKTAKCS